MRLMSGNVSSSNKTNNTEERNTVGCANELSAFNMKFDSHDFSAGHATIQRTASSKESDKQGFQLQKFAAYCRKITFQARWS